MYENRPWDSSFQQEMMDRRYFLFMSYDFRAKSISDMTRNPYFRIGVFEVQNQVPLDVDKFVEGKGFEDMLEIAGYYEMGRQFATLYPEYDGTYNKKVEDVMLNNFYGTDTFLGKFFYG